MRIYALMFENGIIKIGITSNLSTRMSSYVSPVHFNIIKGWSWKIKEHLNPLHVEYKVIKKLEKVTTKARQTTREWFHEIPEDKLLELIENVMKSRKCEENGNREDIVITNQYANTWYPEGIKRIEDNVFDFGKHKGQKIKDVYKSHPSYLEWCLKNCKRMSAGVFNEIVNILHKK